MTTTPTGAALEPCPFCGGDAIMNTHGSEGAYLFWAQCDPTKPDHCGAMVGSASRTKENAIEKWNRRAPSPAALGEGEAELAKLLEKVPEGPYFAGEDEAHDAPAHRGSGLAMVDAGRVSEWPAARLIEWPMAKAIAALLTHGPSLLTAFTERERLRAVAINLNAAVDAMWNDPHRRASNHWPKHERAISAAQQDLKAALSQAQDE
jgi:hypothetical protein